MLPPLYSREQFPGFNGSYPCECGSGRKARQRGCFLLQGSERDLSVAAEPGPAPGRPQISSGGSRAEISYEGAVPSLPRAHLAAALRPAGTDSGRASPGAAAGRERLAPGRRCRDRGELPSSPRQRDLLPGAWPVRGRVGTGARSRFCCEASVRPSVPAGRTDGRTAAPGGKRLRKGLGAALNRRPVKPHLNPGKLSF